MARKTMKKGNVCSCPHHKWKGKILGGTVTAAGVAWLLSLLGTISSSTAMMTYSILVIIVGLFMLAKSACNCCGSGGCC